MVTKEHLKAVLSGQKSFLKMSEVRFVNPPTYDEISVVRLYKSVAEQPGLKKYFPDAYPKGRQCCRAYMFNVWNSIYPEDVKKVIEHANAQRYSVESQNQKDQAIKVTEEWMNELDAMPFVSKRKGKMVHLLKQKSKVWAEMKPRVKYEPFDFMAAKRRNFGSAAETAG